MKAGLAKEDDKRAGRGGDGGGWRVKLIGEWVGEGGAGWLGLRAGCCWGPLGAGLVAGLVRDECVGEGREGMDSCDWEDDVTEEAGSELRLSLEQAEVVVALETGLPESDS